MENQTKGNRRVLYDVNNRGNKTVMRAFNSAGLSGNDLSAAGSTGNWFLLREGYSIVFSGWQASTSALTFDFRRKVLSECVEEVQAGGPCSWGRHDDDGAAARSRKGLPPFMLRRVAFLEASLTNRTE
eukprot:2087277-Rhodomonas_salina.3